MTTPDTAAKSLEEVSAAVLAEVIAHGEATNFLCHTGAMIESAKRLLGAVIFDATPMDERVWVQDMRSAAEALQELRELTKGEDNGR